MSRDRQTLVVCLLLGVLLGVAQPLGELWLECSRKQADACSWDRALLPVTLTIGVVIGLAFGVFFNAVVRAWRARRSS
jgi:hypothetical protein